MQVVSSVLKDEILALVDELPNDELPAARRYLEYVRDLGSDPLLRAGHYAPPDDEEETPDEAAAVQEPREALTRGEVIPDEDLRRELGL